MYCTSLDIVHSKIYTFTYFFIIYYEAIIWVFGILYKNTVIPFIENHCAYLTNYLTAVLNKSILFIHIICPNNSEICSCSGNAVASGVNFSFGNTHS